MKRFPTPSKHSPSPSSGRRGGSDTTTGKGRGGSFRWRHNARAAVLLAASTAVVMAFAPAATSQAPVSVSPKKGGLKKKFLVSFDAPLAAVDSAGEFYVAEVRGPRGCREVLELTYGDVSAGEHVVLALTPRGDIRPFGRRSRWCPGRYSGRVVWCPCADGDAREDQFVGRISFRVRRR